MDALRRHAFRRLSATDANRAIQISGLHSTLARIAFNLRRATSGIWAGCPWMRVAVNLANLRDVESSDSEAAEDSLAEGGDGTPEDYDIALEDGAEEAAHPRASDLP